MKALASFLVASAIRRYVLMVGMNLLPLSTLRIILLRLSGVRIGSGCYIGFNLSVDTNYPELISIGDNVTISHNCVIIAHTQSPVRSPLSSIYCDQKAVHIANGAWIAMNCILLPGSSVGENCFIGAGSIVTSQMPACFLCAGNPCKPLKQLFQ